MITIDKYGNPILTGNRVYKPETPELIFTVNMAGSLVRDGRIAFRHGEWFPSDYVVEGKEPLETLARVEEPAEPEPEPKVPVLTEEETADLHEQAQADQPTETKPMQVRQMEFLKAMKELGSANKALKATGISGCLIQRWRMNDKAFIARYNEMMKETGNAKYINKQNAAPDGSIDSFSDQALVDALRSRGWTVKCEKVVML